MLKKNLRLLKCRLLQYYVSHLGFPVKRKIFSKFVRELWCIFFITKFRTIFASFRKLHFHEKMRNFTKNVANMEEKFRAIFCENFSSLETLVSLYLFIFRPCSAGRNESRRYGRRLTQVRPIKRFQIVHNDPKLLPQSTQKEKVKLLVRLEDCNFNLMPKL